MDQSADTGPVIEEFGRQRPRLLGLAYRMLGSAADAEDVVQDAYLRWQRAEPGSVRAPSAWLVTVTTNLCLNVLDSTPRRRERPAGSWLPEPVLTADGSLGPMETVEQRDTVSLAFLVLAERLPSAERAIFVLREAFGYRHREVAELVELSESNCRQLHRRARERLAGARVPLSGDTYGNRALVAQFLDATRGGDLAELKRMLAEDVVSTPDGGDTRGVARRPVRGADKVVRYLAAVTSRYGDQVTASIREVNGTVAVLGWSGPILLGVLVPDIAGGRITAIRIVADRQKLRFLDHQLTRLSHSRDPSGS